ncbi:hypothetical protein AXF42_Ash017866 [Apostasia shenzhenica]|uniref:Uncharacterized protein n=1 Tax=Apostasia shenzhenica TaxID=1088818 RepID=A0A2I0A3Z5_9ASPA|nr:hypothetical protein AXF42_Ash017866 [Apostasia shenzhenica]
MIYKVYGVYGVFGVFDVFGVRGLRGSEFTGKPRKSRTLNPRTTVNSSFRVYGDL